LPRRSSFDSADRGCPKGRPGHVGTIGFFERGISIDEGCVKVLAQGFIFGAPMVLEEFQQLMLGGHWSRINPLSNGNH